MSEQTAVVCECSSFGTLAVVAELVEEPYWPPEDNWLIIAKFSGITCSLVALIVFSFVIASSPALYDMFHLMHLNTSFNYIMGLLFFAISHSRDLCAEREQNIAVSICLQFFFGVICSFVCAEAFVFFRAVTSGVIGGKTWSYVLLCYGLPVLSVGFTMFVYGDDYGTDPRCFIGWDNDTKLSFIIPLLVTVIVTNVERNNLALICYI